VRAIEFNGCSGGMAKGMRDAGIEFSWCFDWDADACASYEQNLGHRPIKMDIRDVLRMVQGGWSPGPLDLLVADPPCTPWSRAGKREGTADERDLLEVTCELIAILRPAAYLIGNVPGLQDSSSWATVQRVIGGLGRHGYCVADYQQLDAANYGVPQRRIRPFWFGHLAGPCLVWPAPTHGRPGADGALPGLGLRPWVTCREALGHLPAEEMGRPVRLRWKPTDDHRPSAIDEPAKALTTNTHSDGSLLVASREATVRVSKKHPPIDADAQSTTLRGGGKGHAAPAAVLTFNGRHAPAELDAPAPTVAAKVRGQGSQVLRTVGAVEGRAELPQSQRLYGPDEPSPAVQAREDRVGRGSVTLGWPWDRPATSVPADPRLAPSGHHPNGEQRSHPNAIVLSERAAAILQGFPEGWVLVGKTKKSRWSQLGQAMPPAMAAAVGRSIVRQMAATATVEIVDEECA
jgi:site-specific DNA-cytosine methylase